VPCEQTQNQLHGYFDGELDALSAANFEKHLETCAECKTTLAAEEALRQSVRQAALYERAPESLRNKLLAKAPLPAVRSFPTARVSPVRWFAVAAVLLFAVFIGWRQIQFVRTPNGAQLMAASLVDAHLRSLQPGHLTDIESTDQHTVKPWFDGRVDFAPPVRDFANDGFPLLGGRLDVAGGRTLAALVYARRKHVINVFVEKSQPENYWNGAGESQGYHWLAWEKNGLSFCAVSDVAAPDLAQLQQLFLTQ
jgi:mycothiol system anti-sigma-R factor